jgi:hypothetical protein
MSLVNTVAAGLDLKIFAGLKYRISWYRLKAQRAFFASIIENGLWRAGVKIKSLPIFFSWIHHGHRLGSANKKGLTLSRKTLQLWCARQDLNLCPLPSESTATFGHKADRASLFGNRTFDRCPRLSSELVVRILRLGEWLATVR